MKATLSSQNNLKKENKDQVPDSTMCNCQPDRGSGSRIRFHHAFPHGRVGSTAAWSYWTESMGHHKCHVATWAHYPLVPLDIIGGPLPSLPRPLPGRLC
jgi:hypothetical protein